MSKSLSPPSIHGWLVIDKPLGMTSMDVIRQMRRALGTRAIGHIGTLDPLASGVLPLAIGEATKLIHLTEDYSKTYDFIVQYGWDTSTGDAEGAPVNRSDIPLRQEQLMAVIPSFLGDIQQVPPAYSAVKVEGKRAYARARAGENVTLAPRPVQIHHLSLEAWNEPLQQASWRCHCGKGTYIRSLAADMARALGSYGHVIGLRRTQAGPFFEGDTISLEKLVELGHNAGPKDSILPLTAVLDDIPVVTVSDHDALKASQGQAITLAPYGLFQCNRRICLQSSSQMVALGQCSKGIFHPKRVFNL